MRILSKVSPTLKFQRDVPVCAHPTARLLSIAEKSLHPQLPLISLSITEPVPEASLGRWGCPSLHSAGPKHTHFVGW